MPDGATGCPSRPPWVAGDLYSFEDAPDDIVDALRSWWCVGGPGEASGRQA